jgi:hypothetical protein
MKHVFYIFLVILMIESVQGKQSGFEMKVVYGSKITHFILKQSSLTTHSQCNFFSS